jgi:hypothetical protein
VLKPIQQNSLADASKTQQHHSLGWAPIEHAIHIDHCVFEEPVSSSELWRLQSGSWRVWVSSAVHIFNYNKFS